MEDAVLVGVVDGRGDVAGDGECHIDRKLGLAAEPRPESLSLDERHRIVEAISLAPRVQQRNDIGV